MISWSIRTFWYKGSAKNNGNDQFEKTATSLKNSSPDWKVDLSKKSNFDVWRLILIRYDIVLNIQHIILNI